MVDSSSSTSSSLAASMTAMGLFVVTAAVSQWIQNHHERKRENRERTMPGRRRFGKGTSRNRSTSTAFSQAIDSDTDYHDFYTASELDERERIQMLRRRAFQRRRLSRRLSFSYQFESGSSDDSTHKNKNGNEEQQQQQTRRQRQDEVEDDDSFFGNITSSHGSRVRQRPPAPPTEWSLSPHHPKRKPFGEHPVASLPLGSNGTGNPPSSYQRWPPMGPSQESNPVTVTTRLVAINDRYHDFHPKYQNWRHFEHCNERDRALQRQKELAANQQIEVEARIEKQTHHEEIPSNHSQQEAGEVAAESGGSPSADTSSTTSTATPNRLSSSAAIENTSDQESVSTFGNDKNIDNKVSDKVFHPRGNEYVWTNGGHASKYNRQMSSKSDCRFVSGTDDSESSSSPKWDEHQDKWASLSTIRTKNIRSNQEEQSQIGKFERFYRMLSSSIIEDDDVPTAQKTQGNQSRDFFGEPPLRLSSHVRAHSRASSTTAAASDYDGAVFGEDIEDRHRALRTEYNAQIMPEKLVLIRHGQSLGNVDETAYATTSDNAMPITDLGWEQAKKAGTILKDKILNPGESVHFMVSPYVRTVETFHGIVSAWCDPDGPEFADIQDHNRKANAWYERLTELGLTWNEDPRIREQDFGNYQNPEATRKAKEERFRFGTFYYRFNNGESGSDVFDRVSTFLDSLWRSFETNKSQNYVLVTHGIVLRVLMARYFRYTISQLNMLANPRNCEMVVLGHAGDGRLDLEGRCALEMEKDPDTQQSHVKGYQFHRRLRILPKSHIRTVEFRISPMDKKKTKKSKQEPPLAGSSTK